MLDEDNNDSTAKTSDSEAPKPRRAGSRPAGPPAATTFSEAEPAAKPSKKKPAKSAESDQGSAETNDQPPKKAAKKSTKKTAKKAAVTTPEATDVPETPSDAPEETASSPDGRPQSPFATPLFQAPEPAAPKKRKPAPEPEDDAPEPAASKKRKPAPKPEDDAPEPAKQKSQESSDKASGGTEAAGGADNGDDDDGSGSRRRRRRGGRRRRRGGEDDGSDGDTAESGDDASSDTSGDDDKATESAQSDSGDNGADDEKSDNGGSSRRRRRRRRRGEDSGSANDDPANTVTKVREGRSAEDEISSVSGSTRLEAKKQRRREGREAGRRREPIVTESEFLARRESVKREMVIRQRPDRAQIAVLEDDVLVEHYVARESQASMIGNVYLGRVQNVLPSMEAAFIDIGKGRNGVLYAGEVDWKALGNGKPRKIEEALKSGQTVLVQVTKDPVGHKGARLTSQISLAGRFLVYVPGGETNGISRKLPDTERSRLKGLLKEVLPEEAGVIIRTAAEGATEEQLNRDVSALTARWEDIEKKSQGGGNAPQLLYGEPDLMIKVVRDLFNEDFAKLVVEGAEAWDMIDGYVKHVAPDLADRLEHWKPEDESDVFASYRIDEQISKAVDRKVWLPSGGSLIIDRTEAMTVVDVNTGKFTGSGGNLEETVTKNNLEAAEEIVRQLRLRDIGGIIVIDFIDMVLENNRDLVLRRLVECLGRDRTRHQVAEVTSLGLVQMTRKRIGTGLVEAFSETCEHCHGRGLVVHSEPVEPRKSSDDSNRGGRRRGGKGRGDKPKDESKSASGDSGASGGDKPKSEQPKSGKRKSKPKDDVDSKEKPESPKQDAPAESSQSVPDPDADKGDKSDEADESAPGPAGSGDTSPATPADAAQPEPTGSKADTGSGDRSPDADGPQRGRKRTSRNRGGNKEQPAHDSADGTPADSDVLSAEQRDREHARETVAADTASETGAG